MSDKSKGQTREDAEFYKNFVSPKPTKTLTATVGSVTVISRLFGEVSQERLDRETRDIQFRADQLNPVPKRPERIIRMERPGPREEDYNDF